MAQITPAVSRRALAADQTFAAVTDFRSGCGMPWRTGMSS